jgi:hypothetical protein
MNARVHLERVADNAVRPTDVRGGGGVRDLEGGRHAEDALL